MQVEKITHDNRKYINEFIMQHWYTTDMVIRGAIVDMTMVEGLFISDKQDIIGLITYQITGEILEIISLDSVQKNQGIGTMLVNAVIEEAKIHQCKKIILITTNDNVDALRFYQKKGFDMIALYRNAMELSRKLKPEIPLVGDYSIPIRHEIELELLL